MNTELERIGKILVEAESECWHESSGMTWICGNCKTDIGWRGSTEKSVTVESLNPDFSQWQHVGRLLKIANKYSKVRYITDIVFERTVICDDKGISQIPLLVAQELAKIIEHQKEKKA